jgi:flagellar basal body-associated protein FliL
MKKSSKIILAAVVVLLVTVISITVYRLFFQFKNSAVQAFIHAESAKYTSNPVQAQSIIHDAVKHILSSRSLTKEALDYASATGVQKEQVLVTAAVMQAKAYGYLE